MLTWGLMTATQPSPRSRKRWFIIGGLVTLALAAFFIGPHIYAAIQNSRTADELSVDGDAVAAGDLNGTWQAGAGSEAGYRVEEVLNGADVTVVGRTQDLTAALTVTEDQLTAALVEIDMSTVRTDSGSRDRQFIDIVRVRDHPTATFELTEPLELTSLTSGGDLETSAAGLLTIAGIERPAQAHVSVRNTADGLQAAGQIEISFADFDITAPSLGFVRVEDEGLVEFLLMLERAD